MDQIIPNDSTVPVSILVRLTDKQKIVKLICEFVNFFQAQQFEYQIFKKKHKHHAQSRAKIFAKNYIFLRNFFNENYKSVESLKKILCNLNRKKQEIKNGKMSFLINTKQKVIDVVEKKK